jgi:hypothetical protein
VAILLNIDRSLQTQISFADLNVGYGSNVTDHVLKVALAVAISGGVIAGCDAAVTGSATGKSKVSTASCAKVGVVSGTLTAPAALVSDNAATLTQGAFLISDNASLLVSNNQANYRIQGIRELLVASASLDLKDETGARIGATVVTGQDGKFAFADVPCGKTFLVTAKLATYVETAIARSASPTVTSAVTTATTVTTSKLLEANGISALPRVDTAKLAVLQLAVEQVLTPSATEALKTQAGAAQVFDQLASANPGANLTQSAAAAVTPPAQTAAPPSNGPSGGIKE